MPLDCDTLLKSTLGPYVLSAFLTASEAGRLAALTGRQWEPAMAAGPDQQHYEYHTECADEKEARRFFEAHQYLRS